ncbi:uncharacterized protein ASPGLDRAFT_1169381 [Aspergillus glaucus CBS 516.65]|uniref:Uncharacterized protein n=1 Tax=Aspergillus glaucus CBS 516.65 TaxID=1160497 RepID=A0A1L9VU15_ASPGL|nr:hypothetical protein ASPGLDRAFT_1169381 [Aspergillus glaucus CBS 516.65]OJJ87392.1 hypothetical protein ASPGLDRAFT_1169381 [Aspergillus glaucus CBS 516.65]
MPATVWINCGTISAPDMSRAVDRPLFYHVKWLSCQLSALVRIGRTTTPQPPDNNNNNTTSSFSLSSFPLIPQSFPSSSSLSSLLSLAIVALVSCIFIPPSPQTVNPHCFPSAASIFDSCDSKATTSQFFCFWNISNRS